MFTVVVALRKTFCCLLSLLLISLTGCVTDSRFEDDAPTVLLFSFAEGLQGWTGAFSDYALSMQDGLDLVFARRPLPPELVQNDMALFLAGTNLSDDLFMYLKHEVRAVRPDTTYAVTYELAVASNAPSGCVGIGGAPGEAVLMKVGVATVEPVPVLQNGEVRLNIDKDNPPEGQSPRSSVLEVGNIANGVEECLDAVPYRRITLGNQSNPLTVTTHADGTLWLFVGTDSGFEGRTTLFYDTIRVTLVPQ
jgi:hypothetical protein